VIVVLMLPVTDNDFGGVSGTRQVQPIPASSTIAGSMPLRSLGRARRGRPLRRGAGPSTTPTNPASVAGTRGRALADTPRDVG
jgi:hypothetical protein